MHLTRLSANHNLIWLIYYFYAKHVRDDKGLKLNCDRLKNCRGTMHLIDILFGNILASKPAMYITDNSPSLCSE